MKRLPRLFSAALIGVAIATTAACGSSIGADSSISLSYSAYAKAVTAKDGATSANLMSADSFAYYDHIRDLALDATRSTLAQQPLIDQLTVLTMRGTLSAALLRSANAHDLIEQSVDEGLIGNGSLPIVGLQQIRVNGNQATAELVLYGSTTQYPVTFKREAGAWKFDVTSLLGPAESAMTQAQTQQKLSAAKLINEVIVTRFGKARAATLYTPIGRT